jgi:hypothetical protein
VDVKGVVVKVDNQQIRVLLSDMWYLNSTAWGEMSMYIMSLLNQYGGVYGQANNIVKTVYGQVSKRLADFEGRGLAFYKGV